MRVLTPSMVLLNDEFTAKWAIRDWGGMPLWGILES
jgi:hypothetical protein